MLFMLPLQMRATRDKTMQQILWNKSKRNRRQMTDSLWWHGMFVKAGRMGNMAADVQAGSKPEVSAFLYVRLQCRK